MPQKMPHESEQPDDFREHLAAYLAGGLSADDRARIERQAAADPQRRTELEELMALDLSLKQSAGVESLLAGLEDRLAAAVERARPMKRWAVHPLVRRAAVGVAACLLLGTSGYFASQAMEGDKLPGWSEGANTTTAINTQLDGLMSSVHRLASGSVREGVSWSDAEVKGLIKLGTNLTREKRYREALNVVNRILAVDPSNEYATGAKPLIEDKANFQEARSYREFQGQPATRLLNRAEEGKIPYDEILRYPTDWPDISARRDQTVAAEQGDIYERMSGWGTIGQQSSTTSTETFTAPNGTAEKDTSGKAGYLFYANQPGSSIQPFKPGDAAAKASGKDAVVDGISRSSIVAGNTKNHDQDGQNTYTGGTVMRSSIIKGNTKNHDQDGQNVLNADGHVNFEVPSGRESTDRNMKAGKWGGELSESEIKNVRNGVSVPDGGTLMLGGQALAMKDGDGPVEPGKLGNAPATQQGATATLTDGRKIIRSGEVQFEVDRFDSAAATISKIVGEERGVVATTNSDKLPNGKVRGQMIVRIPPGRLDTFILQLRGLGDLKSQRLGSADISKEYTDLQSELRAARAMEERLLDMIKNGKGEIKDLLEAEKELANWRGKIEKIIGQTQYYDNLVSLATLTITLLERDIATPAAAVEAETISAGIEAEDVEKTRSAALSILADAKARIVSSDLKKLDAGQVAATIVADIPQENSGPVIDQLKLLGKVARMEVQRSTTADSSAPTSATHSSTPPPRVEKRDSRLTLSLYNVANVAPRQSSTLTLAATDVSATYSAIVAKVIKAGGRVVSGGATQAQPNASRAQAQIELPADAAEAFLSELKALGEVVALSTTENPDTANVTTSKRGVAMTILPATGMPPRQSASLRIEAGDVESTAANLQAAVLQLGGRVIDSSSATDPAGQSSATLAIEVPLKQAASAVAAVRSLGKTLAVSSSQNPSAPAGELAKARLDVTFATPGPLVGESGLLANVRNGLSISAKGLVYSAQLIVIGLCFVLPWALIVWIGAKIVRRRKTAAAT